MADWLDQLFTYVVAPLDCGDSVAVEIIREPEPAADPAPDPAAPVPAALIATEIVRVPAPLARNRFALGLCLVLVLAGAGAVAAQLSGLV